MGVPEAGDNMPGCRSFNLVSRGKGGEGEGKREEVGKKRRREGKGGKGRERIGEPEGGRSAGWALREENECTHLMRTGMH